MKRRLVLKITIAVAVLPVPVVQASELEPSDDPAGCDNPPCDEYPPLDLPGDWGPGEDYPIPN